jgi:undecaprenyl pyrophosphate phosphatase UppP
MTSFAHVDYPSQHPGVVRAERAAQSLKEVVRGFDDARAGASLLLAAVVAALLVIAGQVVDTWTEGHLLAAWVVMWAVAFAALALLAAPAKRAAAALRAGLRRWAAARKQAAQDEQLWKLALTDARVMADISRAMSASASRDVKVYY